MKENMYYNLNAFFQSYKSYIDYLGMRENSYYEIKVKKSKAQEGFTKVNISIVDSRYNKNSDEIIKTDKVKNNFFSFSNYIILPDNFANILTNKIRDDFRDNHYINYASIKNNKELNLKNTKFTLHIDLNNENDIKEAEKLAFEINCNERKNINVNTSESFITKAKNYLASYLNYLNYIELINNNKNYRITVKKTNLKDNLTKVSILIDDINYDIDGDYRRYIDKNNAIFINYENHIILPTGIANELVLQVENSFLSNHKINYVTVNNFKNELNLKNTIFTLCVKLIDENDFLIANQIRESINCYHRKVLKVSN